MTVPYDIFHKESDGGLLWREAVETMEHVEKRVRELMTKSPGEYLIVNQQTGQRFVIKPDGSLVRQEHNAGGARPHSPRGGEARHARASRAALLPAVVVMVPVVRCAGRARNCGNGDQSQQQEQNLRTPRSHTSSFRNATPSPVNHS